MLHYFVKNFFSPVLISSYQDKDNMVVHVTSDVNEVSFTLSLHIERRTAHRGCNRETHRMALVRSSSNQQREGET